MICSRCREFQPDFLFTGTADGHTDKGELRAGHDRAIFQRLALDQDYPRKRGCMVCCFSGILPSHGSLTLQAGVCGRLYGRLSGEVFPSLLEFDVMKGYPDGNMAYRSCLRARRTKEETSVLEFGLPPTARANEYYFPTVHLVGKTPDYNAVKGWLHQCLTEHEKCSLDSKDVLDQPQSMKRVRLLDVIKRTLVPYWSMARYVALSYVWGAHLQPTIPLGGNVPEQLPLTIEHAMAFVRHLGYRYIWVDSVCIEQGDPSHKKEQIALMSKIYTQAIATLIVLDSPHANHGIHGISFDDDENTAPELSRFGQFRVDLGVGEGVAFYSLHPELKEELKRSQWSQRAWTFQEGMLARRRIILTRHQMYFQCNEIACSEDQPIPQQMDLRYARPLTNPILYMHHFGHADPFRMYSDMIQDYVARHMSKQEDGLNAIAAVFTTWESWLGNGEFMFGLPKWAFRYALLWNGFVVGKYEHDIFPKRRDPSAFPSWSWCGWQLEPNDFSFLADPAFRPEEELFPPLFVMRGGRNLTYDHGRHRMEHDPYRNTETPPFELKPDPVWNLVQDVFKIGDAMLTENPILVPIPKTALQIYGIILRVASKNTITHALYFDVDIESTETEGQVAHVDSLVVMMSISSLVTIYGILLSWESEAQSPGIRSATRIGAMRLEQSKSEFEQWWKSFEARWEGFWLL